MPIYDLRSPGVTESSGEWTPTLSLGNHLYTNTEGHWRRIGAQVFLDFNLVVSKGPVQPGWIISVLGVPFPKEMATSSSVSVGVLGVGSGFNLIKPAFLVIAQSEIYLAYDGNTAVPFDHTGSIFSFFGTISYSTTS